MKTPIKETQPAESSGLRSPGEPPANARSIEVSKHYLDFYQADYARARQVVKSRANFVAVAAAALNGLIAVVGAAVAVFAQPWLGLVSTLLASAIAVLMAWDGLFRHREMWIQRSAVLGELQALSRATNFRIATGEDEELVASNCMIRLNAILESDLTSWTQLRASERRTQEQPIGPATSGTSD